MGSEFHKKVQHFGLHSEVTYFLGRPPKDVVVKLRFCVGWMEAGCGCLVSYDLWEVWRTQPCSFFLRSRKNSLALVTRQFFSEGQPGAFLS